MKKSAFLFVFILGLSVAAFAQKGKTPTFAQYRVRAEKITPKPVDLSTRNARMYRTNLRNAAKDGINFAGHYILTTWGCGTNCNEGAIIDARTGRVFFPRELAGIGIGQGTWANDLELLEFKANSTLLILNGYDGGSLNRDNPSEGIYYYQWTGNALKKIRFVRKSSN